MKKTIPEFASEEEEIEFWGSVDADDYFEDEPCGILVIDRNDWDRVSFRVPPGRLEELAEFAEEIDVPLEELLLSLVNRGFRQLRKEIAERKEAEETAAPTG